jgi:FkbM family methyltransferase
MTTSPSNLRAPNLKGILRWIYGMLPLKQPIFQIVRNVVSLPERYYRHLHFHGVFRVKIDNGASFLICHHGYQVENDLFWGGYGKGWEATSLRLWQSLARNSSVILDIGANTGVFALAAKAVNPGAQVFAFEPIKRIFERLSENIMLNGFDAEPVLAGVSNLTGEATIYVPVSEHSYSASLDATMMAGRAELCATQISVTRIDDFVASRVLKSLDLVKIDAEQHELAVVLGFGDTLKRFRPCLLIEVLNTELGQKLAPFFTDLNYVFFEIVERRGVRPVNVLGAASGNYLICPAELAKSQQIELLLIR